MDKSTFFLRVYYSFILKHLYTFNVLSFCLVYCVPFFKITISVDIGVVPEVFLFSDLYL